MSLPESDARALNGAISRLPARLRDLDEPNALIVRRRAADLIERYETALIRISGHTVVSEGESPDDNCDWHCTATIVAEALDALDGR